MTGEKKRRRGHGEGTAYQRPDGRWQWRVTMPDGSRKSFYGATRREAKEKAETAIAEMRDGLDLASTRLTVAGFLSTWLETTAADRLRPTTLRLYRIHVDRYIVPAIGAERLRTLTPQHVNRMLARMTGNGIAASSANRTRAVLRTALASAVKAGYVARNVAALSDVRKERKQPVQPLTLEQVHTLLDGTRDSRHGPLWHVAIATGAREGELLALRWQDVELTRGVIHIRHTLTRYDGAWHLSDPKTEGSRRDVKLTADAVAALERQQVTVAELEQLAAHRWQDYGFVFPSDIGTPQHAGKVLANLRRDLDRLGLPAQRFHDLRHCTASLLLAEGLDIFTVKAILGHASITLTSDTYGHLTRKLADEAAARLGRALDAKTDAKTEHVTNPSTDGVSTIRAIEAGAVDTIDAE